MNFKRTFIKVLIVFCLLMSNSFTVNKAIKYKCGDIIFLSNGNVPDKLLQSLTKSKYSHIGLVIKEKGSLQVCYAGNKVKKVSLPEFLLLAGNGKYEVMRFKDTLLISSLCNLMNEESNKLVGNVYDFKYSWLDKEIYNSELIWKIYKRAANTELCAKTSLKTMNIADTLVRRKIKTIFGDTIPETSKIVSPTDLYNSEFLSRVK